LLPERKAGGEDEKTAGPSGSNWRIERYTTASTGAGAARRRRSSMADATMSSARPWVNVMWKRMGRSSL